MNERIRELAEHAELPNPHVPGQWRFNNQQLGFFARLIVRECISAVENLSPGYQDYRNQIEDAFRRDCVEQIKQHFGVEK